MVIIGLIIIIVFVYGIFNVPMDESYFIASIFGIVVGICCLFAGGSGGSSGKSGSSSNTSRKVSEKIRDLK